MSHDEKSAHVFFCLLYPARRNIELVFRLGSRKMSIGTRSADFFSSYSIYIVLETQKSLNQYSTLAEINMFIFPSNWKHYKIPFVFIMFTEVNIVYGFFTFPSQCFWCDWRNAWVEQPIYKCYFLTELSTDFGQGLKWEIMHYYIILWRKILDIDKNFEQKGV